MQKTVVGRRLIPPCAYVHNVGHLLMFGQLLMISPAYPCIL